MKEIASFVEKVVESFQEQSLIKLTLSKSKAKNNDLVNVYVRSIVLKNDRLLSFNYRYKTNDQTKNYTITEATTVLLTLFEEHFLTATLFSTQADYVLLGNLKGHYTFLKQKSSQSNQPKEAHNREKIKRSNSNDLYLQLLGIANDKGDIIPTMADKFRQINKYLEIIDNQLEGLVLPEVMHIVDMGSGKGYLTFALYDYLTNKRKLKTYITGIELRPELVEFCNVTARKCGFENLSFICERIEHFNTSKIDMLIALHACDTATDDALFKAISADARLIVCAPCCHKQIRQQVKGKVQQSPLLKYGIFKERHFEMVTDTLRALILEKYQYATHIFEFVSNEHTRKNIMLVARKGGEKSSLSMLNEKIDALKHEYQIEYHYLEQLLK